MTDSLSTLLPRIYAALDEHRFDDLAAFYTSDVVAMTPGGELRGQTELVDQARRNHAGAPALQHLVTSLLIEPDGDSATVRANLVAVFADAERAPAFELGGVWRGRARHVEDGWRIAEFAIIPVWQRGVRPTT